MKLLYAEDEAAMSEAMVDILTYHKYAVDAVYDGEEALAYAHAEQYDGIILDIMMPKRDGLEVLRQREEFTPEILTCGDVSLNLRSYELSGNGQSFVLPKLEYRLMELLMLNQGMYLSSGDLLVRVWGYDTDAEIGIVWVYISYLRKRLAALGSYVTVRARRNIGYMLDAGNGQ